MGGGRGGEDTKKKIHMFKSEKKARAKEYFPLKEINPPFQYNLPTGEAQHLGNLQACLSPGYGEQQ